MASPDVSGSGPDISPTTGRFETIEEAMQHARWALDRAHRQRKQDPSRSERREQPAASLTWDVRVQVPTSTQ